MKELEKYVGECFSIDFEDKQNRFKIFTIPTQHFYVESLGELTPERFDLEIKKQKECEEQTRKNLFKAMELWHERKGTNKEEYWEQQGYDAACWGYPILDHVWDDDERYPGHPKKYQKVYRLGQWRAYEEGKSFKGEKPWFDKPKQR